MSKQLSEILTLPNFKDGSDLLKAAETLIEFRGYRIEHVSQSPSIIDIRASQPGSSETVMMHIVTQTDLKNNGVGVDALQETEHIHEIQDVDKTIVFGNQFTASAQKELHDEGIEFFSPTQNILSTLNHRELYNNIVKNVDALCSIKCGSTPQSSTDCLGYSKKVTACPQCNGRGKLDSSSSTKYLSYCTVCGGSGEKEGKYRCSIRLISDNADFHYRKGWHTLLNNDLLELVDLAHSKQQLASETLSR